MNRLSYKHRQFSKKRQKALARTVKRVLTWIPAIGSVLGLVNLVWEMFGKLFHH
jgi:hypothetical protein